MVIIIFLIILYLLYQNNEYFTQNKKNLNDKIYFGLKIIDKIFNKYNIYYSVAYGTLLGAVRHHEMIKWDDDADIHILHEDINKIMNLKKEFAKYGLRLEKNWKLLKIYFDDSDYPFIDLFPIKVRNNKVIRCMTRQDRCLQVNGKWWKSWYGFKWNYINNLKYYNFGKIKVLGPKKPKKILKYWYGPNCLTHCKTQNYNHITGTFQKTKTFKCKNLPKPQL
jgi:hypothetical protein